MIVILITACNDIIERDISGDTVSVIIPAEHDTLTSNNVHFKWNELKGARFYKLEIVSPSFSDIQNFILDSNIVKTEFYQILNPGNYEFRIRAENTAHQSLYTAPIPFYVDSLLDLNEQFVFIISPIDGQFLNGNSDIHVSWQNLFAAETFDFVLKMGENFESASTLDQSIDQVTLSRSVSSDYFELEGRYFVGVRGKNDISTTPFSYHEILVDKTNPNIPDLMLPEDSEVFEIDEEFTFKWSTGIDGGEINSPVYSTVELSNSELFTTYTTFSEITSDSLEHSFPSAGSYYWRVSTIDGVDNMSVDYSEVREVIIE